MKRIEDQRKSLARTPNGKPNPSPDWAGFRDKATIAGAGRGKHVSKSVSSWKHNEARKKKAKKGIRLSER